MLEQWAEQVVRDASEIIGHDVLITNREGSIIASSESPRVGTLHTPSLKVLRTRQVFYTTPEEARGMVGVYPGITLPIEHGGRVVGSIAIAGNPEEVGKFGELVRRQAELYLREKTLAESRVLLERAVEELVQEVAFFDPEEHDEEVLLYRARELGFDLEGTRVALAIQLISPFREMAEEERLSLLLRERGFSFQGLRENLVTLVERIFSPVFTPGAFCGKERFLLFKPFLADREENLEYTRLLDQCSSLMGLCGERNISLSIGVGNPGKGIGALSGSSREALRALRLGSGKPGIFEYRKLLLEDLLAGIPSKRRSAFVRRFLGPLEGRSDAEDLRKTFFLWWENPNRPGEVAKKMHLHRNSVSLRIEKLGNLVGLDLRDFRQGVLLYLAYLCEKE
ncbi:MAG TPA: sugar diacid recognition domain-containing protein [Synergistaceae bacterium]|nr:sugar diacid recognition domain-containing protein [Synergistaceae bacterium]HPJ26450.1 sugar diacid recognition domain-containing protein [Synergistaceae bacterium]HPQ37156.1 sugar diacid recognition domain-containing protein [Synergistaceae bacterium]